MANIQDDVRKFILEINESKNNGQTLSNLTKLEKETGKLRAENEELQKVMGFLASQGKKTSDEYQRMEAKLKQNKKTVTQNNVEMKGLRKTLDLNYLSMGDLKKRAMELRSTLGSMSKAANPEEYNRLEKELKQVGGQMDKLRGKSAQTQGILGKLKGAAGGLLPAFSFTAILYGVKEVIGGLFKLTKQIQGETIRSTTVLGDQMGYVEEQADKLASKMGVTNREFVSMVANTGDLLIPLDFSRKKAAEMATQVQGLSGALDEWTAGKYGVAEVSNILTKAMLGENEQLKQLGIAIRKDTDEFRDLVAQKIEDEGVTKQQAEAMATLELIYKKSTDAQAAYERGGNKLLRVQKSITLWWTNMKESAATYLSTTANERLLKQVDDLKKIEDQFKNESKTLDSLIISYDDLKKKGTLTKDEQIELNNAIRDIGKIVPTAITEFNKYGEAIGINKDKIIEAREAQRLLNLEMKGDVINDLLKSVGDDQKRIDQANDYIERISQLINDESSLQKAAALTGKTQQEIENEYIQGIQKSNESIRDKNRQLAQTVLKLKEIGLTEEEISLSTGIAVSNLNEIVANYLKTVNSASGDNLNEETEAAKSLIDVQKELLDDANKMPETTEREIAAKNRKIKAIEEEISRLNDLGLASKIQIKLEEFWSSDSEAQQEAIIKYFHEAGTNAYDEFIAAIEARQAEQQAGLTFPVSVEQDEEVKADPSLDYAIQQYQQSLDYKQALLQMQWENGIIGEQEYQDRLTELNRTAEEQRFDEKMQYAEKARQLSQVGLNFVSALMQLELERAGDNEEKKKEIRKKYALMQFAASASQIIVDTATAVMKALAELGPIAGAIAAGFIGATGAVQLGIAYGEMQKMKGMKEGGFAESGANDSEPAGIYHKNEWIANAPTVRENKPFFELLNAAQRNGTMRDLVAGIMSGVGRRSGGYAEPSPAPTSANLTQPYTSTPDPAITRLLSDNLKATKQMTAAAEKLWKDGTYTRLLGRDGLIKQEAEYQKMKSNVTL